MCPRVRFIPYKKILIFVYIFMVIGYVLIDFFCCEVRWNQYEIWKYVLIIH